MSRSSLFLKAKNAVKFLLFREDHPKQGSVSFEVGVMMFVSLTVIVAFCSVLVWLGFMAGGFVGLVMAYVGVCFGAIEVPHIIFDR